MTKKLIVLLLGVAMMATVTGCKDDSIMTMGEYTGLEIEECEYEIEATEEDVEKSINTTIDEYVERKGLKEDNEWVRTIAVEDAPAEIGDVVNIDYVGTKDKDDVAFDGGTAEGYDLELGSNSFIPGFEEGIVGHKVGEKFDLNLTFPEDYHEASLKGQKVVFSVTINKITRTLYVELDDEKATELYGSEITVEEFREKQKADMEASNKEAEKSYYSNMVWEELIATCEVKAYPEEDIARKKKEIEANYSYVTSYGFESVAAFFSNYYGMSVEEVAKDMLKQEYAIQMIMEEEKMEITEEDYQKGLLKYAEEYGYDVSDEEKVKEFEETVTAEAIRDSLKFDMVTEFLLENCKYVEAEEEIPEETTEGTEEEAEEGSEEEKEVEEATK